MEQRSEQNVCILVVDDEQDIRRIIRILLESSGYQVAEAPNGLAAVEYIRQQPNVDLVLMDIMMPGLNGIEASRAIRERCSAPILFLTAKTQERDKLEAYQAGGDDYLAKPFSHAELMMKVESLLRRYRVYKGKTSGQLLRADVMLDEPGRRVLRGGRPVELTRREFDIVAFLSKHPGQVFDRDRIHERVGGWENESDSQVVTEHIRRIRKKLAAAGAEPDPVETVWGMGYRWRA